MLTRMLALVNNLQQLYWLLLFPFHKSRTPSSLSPIHARLQLVTSPSCDPQQCMRLEANERPTCTQLLRHDFFTQDDFSRRFPSELKAKIAKESDSNPLLVKIRAATSKDTSDDKDSKENNNKRKKKDYSRDKYATDKTERSHNNKASYLPT